MNQETDTPPTDASTIEQAASSETVAEAPTASPSAPVSEQAEQTPTAPPNEVSERPSERILVGTQKAATAGAEEAMAAAVALKPNPVNRVTEGESKPTDTKAYPPPNARTAPTDDEEAELAKLMEGSSVDQVLETEAAAAPKQLAEGSKAKVKVVRVSGDSVFVELGQHLEGLIPLKQFEPKKQAENAPAAVAEAPKVEAEPPAEGEMVIDPKDPMANAPEIGAELEVIVGDLNADESMYELSLPTAAVDIGNWDEVEAGKIVEVSITGHNKGGLECKISGIRGFMPMGQISLFRVEKPEEYVGQRLRAVITEANRGRKNVILSHRAVMERERAEQKDKLLAELAPGQLRDGVVRSLRDFGAFVDLGGIDGLIHVSKLSWDRIGHPKEVLSEGETVKVKIEKIDPETGKIALSYREAAANPWDSAEADYPVGTSVKGKVTKTMDFGAFVRLGPGVEGLIHISELDHKRVHRVTDVVSEGQEVETKVLSVDRGKQRIALSLKALSAAPAKADRAKKDDYPEEPENRPPRKEFKNLKGGTGGGSGGEQFGLKW